MEAGAEAGQRRGHGEERTRPSALSVCLGRRGCRAFALHPPCTLPGTWTVHVPSLLAISLPRNSVALGRMQESKQRPHKDTVRVLSVRNGPGSRKFAEINAEPAVEEQPAPAGAAGGAGVFFPNRGRAGGPELGPGRPGTRSCPLPPSCPWQAPRAAGGLMACLPSNKLLGCGEPVMLGFWFICSVIRDPLFSLAIRI